MKPQQKRLHDRLEQMLWHARPREEHADDIVADSLENEQELEQLLVVAQHLRALPQVQVAPGFVGQLETRVLHRAAELRLQRVAKRRSVLPILRLRPALVGTLGFCLLFLLLSTGLLAFAAQVSNPTNPLYALKRLEQHLQISMAGDQSDQAALDLQFAYDGLKALSSLADPVHAVAYAQALADLDQNLRNAALAINALPVDARRVQLAAELTGQQTDAVHVLRDLLPALSFAERLATTAELARLGNTVAIVLAAAVTLPPHPNGHALISLSGRNFQGGAQLLVDGRSTGVTGTLEHDQLVFTLTSWNGARHPHMLGILNPDGTAAQTTAITVRLDAGDGNGSLNGNNKGNGNGGNGNGNRPQATPTPHH
jgi:hypothetical protein